MLRDRVPPPASIVPRDPLIRLLQHSMFVTSMPLKTKLLFVVRAPFTLGEIEALSLDSSSLMSAETPGSMASSCVMLRADVGSDSSSRRSSVRTMVAESVTTMRASALTSTASVIVADLERRVNRGHLSGRDDDAVALKRLEPGLLEGDAIGSGRQKARFPFAGRVGGRGSLDAGFRPGHGDPHAVDRRTAGVGDTTRTGRFLHRSARQPRSPSSSAAEQASDTVVKPRHTL